MDQALMHNSLHKNRVVRSWRERRRSGWGLVRETLVRMAAHGFTITNPAGPQNRTSSGGCGFVRETTGWGPSPLCFDERTTATRPRSGGGRLARLSPDAECPCLVNLARNAVPI